MLVEPQLLVVDRLFEGLGYEEQQSASALLALFERRYPLRKLLYVAFTESGRQLLGDFQPLQAKRVTVQ
jgi:hypothetical protein